MGQVPAPLGIIGDGRMARHFTHYLDLCGVPYRRWSRRSPVPLAQTLESCGAILALIRDDALEPFLQGLPAEFRQTRKWIHFSGSLVTPLAPGFHPLMTFGENLYDQKTYERTPFVVEAASTPEARAVFTEIFPTLANPVHALRAEDKPRYHALCVMSGNFTTLLWQKFFRELEVRFGLPREVALPYLEQISANLEQDPDHALTGPIARRDFGTLARNRAALGDDAFGPIFDAFTRLAQEGVSS